MSIRFHSSFPQPRPSWPAALGLGGLWRSSNRFGVTLDFKVFKYGTVVLVHVDLVIKDGGGQTAETLPVLVDVQLHIPSLVVGDPRATNASIVNCL